MRMKITLLTMIFLLFCWIIFERVLYQEHVQFLERCLGIEKGHSLLKKGMPKEDVLDLFYSSPNGTKIKPDNMVETENKSYYRWSQLTHQGTITTFLGLNEHYEKSGLRILDIEFDEDGFLISVYWGA